MTTTIHNITLVFHWSIWYNKGKLNQIGKEASWKRENFTREALIAIQDRMEAQMEQEREGGYEFFTPEQLAKKYNLGTSHRARRLIRDEGVPRFVINGRVLVRRDHFESWLDQHLTE